MSTNTHIRELITRLARLNAAETWNDDLNPVQVAAISYLARANRFSRRPSFVAEYLGTTRGTMSKTLRSLERKGYVSEIRSITDKRSISYDLTPDGEKIAARSNILDLALSSMPEQQKMQLENALSAALLTLVNNNNGRAFGVCKTCLYHQHLNGKPYCNLLKQPLEFEDAEKICNEQLIDINN